MLRPIVYACGPAGLWARTAAPAVPWTCCGATGAKGRPVRARALARVDRYLPDLGTPRPHRAAAERTRQRLAPEADPEHGNVRVERVAERSLLATHPRHRVVVRRGLGAERYDQVVGAGIRVAGIGRDAPDLDVRRGVRTAIPPRARRARRGRVRSPGRARRAIIRGRPNSSIPDKLRRPERAVRDGIRTRICIRPRGGAECAVRDAPRAW